jgi:hypothetical protein
MVTNCLEQFGTKLEKEIKDKILLAHWRAQSQLAMGECSLVGVLKVVLCVDPELGLHFELCTTIGVL